MGAARGAPRRPRRPRRLPRLHPGCGRLSTAMRDKARPRSLSRWGRGRREAVGGADARGRLRRDRDAARPGRDRAGRRRPGRGSGVTELDPARERRGAGGAQGARTLRLRRRRRRLPLRRALRARLRPARRGGDRQDPPAQGPRRRQALGGHVLLAAGDPRAGRRARPADESGGQRPAAGPGDARRRQPPAPLPAGLPRGPRAARDPPDRRPAGGDDVPGLPDLGQPQRRAGAGSLRRRPGVDRRAAPTWRSTAASCRACPRPWSTSPRSRRTAPGGSSATAPSRPATWRASSPRSAWAAAAALSSRACPCRAGGPGAGTCCRSRSTRRGGPSGRRSSGRRSSRAGRRRRSTAGGRRPGRCPTSRPRCRA